MTLSPGSRLGPYEVAAQIGVGGMGEVYRATDTNLKRQVAIKVLPASVAADPERLARFQREAEVLASLNHPNIAAIHGLERTGGTTALVMELVEGPTLADRIALEAIPFDEALAIAKQIVEALEAAHEQGIIHRDLKPANIKVRQDGTVKVLDFGLAKAMAPVGAIASGGTMSPTITTPAMTQAGIILGTAAYMSPEQARGRSVDKRADIWSFGVVLYEMLTGERLFKGEDLTETLASVVKDQPDVSRTPMPVRRLLARCLEKDPRRRVRDIGDVWDLLDDAASSGAAAAAPPSGWRHLVPWSVAAIVLSAAVAGVAAWQLKPSVPRQVIRFAHELPAAADLRVPALPVVAISADGRRVAYNTTSGVYLLSTDALEPRLIPGTEPALTNLMFSPDGDWIAYLSVDDLRLRKMPVNGGSPVVVMQQPLNLASFWGASWGADNQILFTQGQKVMRVSADGGMATEMFEVDSARGQPGFPELLPGGRSVLFSVTAPEGNQIVARSLDSGDVKVVHPGLRAHYLPTGHLVYSAQNSLFVEPFDVAALASTGGAVPVADSVMSGGIPQYAISESGSLVYVTGASTQKRALAIASPDGVAAINVPVGLYSSPRVSPDGTQVVVQTTDGDVTPINASSAAIWVADLSGKTAMRRLTQQGKNFHPIWTPDGKRVTFASDRDGPLSIYWQPADGSRSAERLTTAKEGTQHFPDSWSPDGRSLVYQLFASTAKVDLWTLSLDAPDSPTAFAAGSRRNHGGVFSPNGRWVAYGSTEENPLEQIYVEPFPKTGVKYQLTRDEGAFPLWSRDGNSLFFRRVPRGTEGTGTHLVQLDIAAGAAFAWRNERQLPIKGFQQFGGLRDFDVMPDGKRFVMLFPAPNEQGEADRPRINVVVNWVQELERLVGRR